MLQPRKGAVMKPAKSIILLSSTIAMVFFWAMPGTAHGQIYVANYGISTIGEYTTSGAPVGSGTLVSSGLDLPNGIAVSGSDIFVTNLGNNTIGEYTTSGAPVGSGTLVSSGLDEPVGIAVVAAVPEPADWTMLATGLCVCVLLGLRKMPCRDS